MCFLNICENTKKIYICATEVVYFKTRIECVLKLEKISVIERSIY